MSILRFMMLSYMICNFEKIITRLFFLIIYIYISSVSIVALHDGLPGFLKYKEPVVLYVRMYSIAKWYYHNRDMLSFGMGFKIFLVLGSTFILQYSIWNINWKIVPIMVLRFFKRCIFSIRYGKSALRGAVVRINVNGFDNIRNKIIDEIDDGLQDIWGTILISRKQKTTEEDLTSLKKSLLIKISYQIDEFIHNALKSIEK